MDNQTAYSKDEVIHQLRNTMNLVANLDNFITDLAKGLPEGDNGMPVKRIKEKVNVNGEIRWIDGYSFQEICDNYVRLLVREGLIEWISEDEAMPNFEDYAKTYYDTFKRDQESNTVINRERILRNHILPVFGKKKVDRIRTTDIQRWLNKLSGEYSKETILKIKNIMSPVLDAAVEDNLIEKNPMASKRIKISGKDTVHHKAIPKEVMKQIKMAVGGLPWKERVMAGLLCYTGMRFEEVLGLRWEDISSEWVIVRRAVVHPTRNQPEVKKPKTKTSERRIPLHPDLKNLLGEMQSKGYLLATNKDKTCETPLSYTEARRIFEKIRKRFSIEEYTAHDFRDTCATEWRENGIPLDVVARLLGHSKTETTEKRYVKYRDAMLDDVRGLM